MKFILNLILFSGFILNTPLLSAEKQERIFVGELGAEWQFPSDHLPIGAKIDCAYNFVSWNVLNSAYLHWIYNNDQGLAGSLITQEDIRIDESQLSIREQHVINELIEMTDKEMHVICLQECSELFIQNLKVQLPKHMKIVRSLDQEVKNQNIVIYNGRFFTLSERTLNIKPFPSDPTRPLMEIVLSANSKLYRIFNAHLKCDSSKTQRFELSNFVKTHKQHNEVTIVLGDLNVDQSQMIEAFNDESYQPISPYRTTVSPELYSKAIDHIFVNGAQAEEIASDELLEDLSNCVKLLSVER